MSLNIKSERVHQLAREAARVTGKSQTSVIEEALVRLLADHDRGRQMEERRRRVHQLLEEIDATMTVERQGNIQEAMNELYDDETGLPR